MEKFNSEWPEKLFDDDSPTIKIVYFVAEMTREHDNYLRETEKAKDHESALDVFYKFIKTANKLRKKYDSDKWTEKDVIKQKALKNKIEETIRKFIEETNE